MVVRKPARNFLDELEIKYDEQEEYIVIKHAALFTSTIMSKLLAKPNVKLFNVVAAEDLIIKGGRVGGIVTNWALVAINHDTQSCMDPNVMEAKVIVSSCGHDGSSAPDVCIKLLTCLHVADRCYTGLWESVILPRIEMINMGTSRSSILGEVTVNIADYGDDFHLLDLIMEPFCIYSFFKQDSEVSGPWTECSIGKEILVSKRGVKISLNSRVARLRPASGKYMLGSLLLSGGLILVCTNHFDSFINNSVKIALSTLITVISQLQISLAPAGFIARVGETRSFKNNEQGSSTVPKRKSVLNSVAKQVSQAVVLLLALAIRVTTFIETLRVHIKLSPSDQIWFGFTSMPDIDFSLESSVGDHKITSGHIALFIINKLKFSTKVFHIDVPILYAFTNEMITNINVLASSMKSWVPDECYR
ncbi:thiamine thiazole synthase, chloroplastic-like protein [Tanacetum coccineum]